MRYKIVATKLSEDQICQLDRIRRNFKFKSRYEILQNLVTLFLKSYSEKRSFTDSGDITDMFRDFAEVEEPDFVKPKRALNKIDYGKIL